MNHELFYIKDNYFPSGHSLWSLIHLSLSQETVSAGVFTSIVSELGRELALML